MGMGSRPHGQEARAGPWAPEHPGLYPWRRPKTPQRRLTFREGHREILTSIMLLKPGAFVKAYKYSRQSLERDALG